MKGIIHELVLPRVHYISHQASHPGIDVLFREGINQPNIQACPRPQGQDPAHYS